MAGVTRSFWVNCALFALASPVLVVKAALRTRDDLRYIGVATAPAIVCECGAEVSLVGLWRCGCGFTYRGHLLRVCPVCNTTPCVVRCYRCGVTTKLPEAR